MPKSDDDFSFFEIDQNLLDEEWIRQPQLYFEYAKRLADARRDHDQQKAALDVVVAELDKAIREDPEKFGIEKVSETAIKLAIVGRKKHKAAVQAVADAKHAVDVLQAVVNALDHRKRALENLVDLWAANYFSTPRASDESAREVVQDLEVRSRGAHTRKKKRREADE